MSKIMYMDDEYASNVTTPMTIAEAEAGISEGLRVITPKLLHDYVGNVEFFNGTRDSAISSGDCNGVCIFPLGLAIVNFYFSDDADITSGQTLFNVPEAYRPVSVSENQIGSGFIAKSSGTTPGRFRINPSGNIAQITTNVARSGNGIIVYSL